VLFGYDRRIPRVTASGSRRQIVRQSRRPASNRVSSFLLFATAAAAPLPFGSTDHSSVALWCIVLGGAAAAASFAGLRKTEVALLAAIGLIVLAYSIVLHEQLSTTPGFQSPSLIRYGGKRPPPLDPLLKRRCRSRGIDHILRSARLWPPCSLWRRASSCAPTACASLPGPELPTPSLACCR
jgi:hypothetical protein